MERRKNVTVIQKPARHRLAALLWPERHKKARTWMYCKLLSKSRQNSSDSSSCSSRYTAGTGKTGGVRASALRDWEWRPRHTQAAIDTSLRDTTSQRGDSYGGAQR